MASAHSRCCATYVATKSTIACCWTRGAYPLLNILRSPCIYLSPGSRTQWFLLLLRPEHVCALGPRAFPLFPDPGLVLDSAHGHPYMYRSSISRDSWKDRG